MRSASQQKKIEWNEEKIYEEKKLETEKAKK